MSVPARRLLAFLSPFVLTSMSPQFHREEIFFPIAVTGGLAAASSAALFVACQWAASIVNFLAYTIVYHATHQAMLYGASMVRPDGSRHISPNVASSIQLMAVSGMTATTIVTVLFWVWSMDLR